MEAIIHLSLPVTIHKPLPCPNLLHTLSVHTSPVINIGIMNIPTRKEGSNFFISSMMETMTFPTSLQQ